MLWPGIHVRWRDLARALWTEYNRDEVMDVAAALTFYAFLALFPFLLFLVALASRILTPSLIHGLLDDVRRVAPEAVARLVGSRLAALERSGGPGLLTFSLAGATWSVMSAVVSLTSALNRAYDVEESRSFLRIHGIALLTTVILGAIALVAALIAVGVPFLASQLGGAPGRLLGYLRFPLAGALMMLVWAVSYRYLPNVRPRRHTVIPGAIVGVALWLLASLGFTEYVRWVGSYEVLYGTLGGVAILLLWVWISGQIMLLGGELNKLLTPPDALAELETRRERERIELPLKKRP